MKTFFALSALLLNISLSHAAVKTCKGLEETKPIKFLNEFFVDLANGKKTATTRKGIRCYKVGSVVNAVDDKDQVKGQLKVKKVEVLNFGDMSESLAKAEGTTLKDLKEGLVEIYGEEIKSLELSSIYFEYIPSKATVKTN